MIRTLLLVATFLILSSSALADEPPRTINASGEAMVNVIPDEVILQFGIETYSADLDESKSANDEAAKRLVSAIKAFGVEDKHLRTDVLQMEIVYKHNGIREGIAGYAARRGFSVTLKDPSRFEHLVDTVLKNGANVIMGFEFRTTELRKHRDEARKLAIRAAREKAQALAGELDCTLGPPRNINEHGGYYGYWGANFGWRGGRNISQNVIQDMGGRAPMEGGDTLPLGQIAVSATVGVTFDLLPPRAP